MQSLEGNISVRHAELPSYYLLMEILQPIPTKLPLTNFLAKIKHACVLSFVYYVATSLLFGKACLAKTKDKTSGTLYA